MTADRFCFITIFSLLPLLFLPQAWLMSGVVWAGCLAVIAIYQRSTGYLLCAACVAVSFLRISHFAENLQNQTAYKREETIEIVQILKQGEFQTAIAERENGERLYLTWQSDTALLFGQTYLAQLNVKPLSSRLNEGNFNRQRWYIANRLHGTATVKHAQPIKHDHGLRASWLERTQQQLDGLNGKGLVLALAFGERAWLPAEQWQIFQQTATAHLIAISGLHIALAMGLGFYVGKGLLFVIMWLTAKLGRPQAVQNPHFFAITCGFMLAWGYSFLAGFSIPTVRAIVAISVVLLCRLQRWHYTAWQYWLRCVTFLILYDPFTLLSDSFWLSVLAVAGLIFWYRHFPLSGFLDVSEWKKRHKILTPMISLIHLQVGIGLCFLPVQLYFFEGLSPFAFLANLLIVPLYSVVIVPLILFGLFAGSFLPIWVVIDKLIVFSLFLLEPLSHHWAVLSRAEQWLVLTLVLFILALLYYRKQWREALSSLVVAACAFYQSGFLLDMLREKPLVEWVNFDIGQGLAMAFVYSENDHKKAIVYDTGASWAGGSMAELEMLPYFAREGIELDAVIVSHDDNDHAGGVLPLLAKYPKVRLILSSKNHYSASHIEPCTAGQTWQFGGLTLSALYPFQQVERAKNQDSCVILAQVGRHQILLTGDAGVEQEREFASHIGKVDFLQVGHHGSKTSTSYTLLANTQPTWAVISAGRFNPWKMPNLSVTERLETFGVKHLNTAQVGMIKVDFYPSHYRIKTARHANVAWYSGYFGKN